MEIEGRIHPEQGLMYWREDLRKILGHRVRIVPDSKAVVVFPEGADYKQVIRSLEIILEDLRIKAGEKR